MITLGRHAMADGVQDEVSNHLKEEYIKMDVQKRTTEVAIPQPIPLGGIEAEDWTVRTDMAGGNDSQISHSDNISPAEQEPGYARPRAGISKKYDPLDSIEEKIADDQAYQLYNEHYRRAVKQEFIDRAKKAGYDPSDTLAEHLIR